MRSETLELVQERARNTLQLKGIVNDFLSRTQMAQQLREKIDKWDYMKWKSTRREMLKMKKLPTEWEKIFASYMTDKGLITRIYRELKKLNFPQINDPMKKWAKELDRAFSLFKIFFIYF
jgi:hypothetical protein